MQGESHVQINFTVVQSTCHQLTSQKLDPFWAQPSQQQTHTPSIAFRHLPPRKDVVSHCLEFAAKAATSRAVNSKHLSLFTVHNLQKDHIFPRKKAPNNTHLCRFSGREKISLKSRTRLIHCYNIQPHVSDSKSDTQSHMSWGYL